MTVSLPPEHDRDDRDVARALADGREDAIDSRAGDRAPLELQPLGDGERRGRRAEQGEDDQRVAATAPTRGSYSGSRLRTRTNGSACSQPQLEP